MSRHCQGEGSERYKEQRIYRINPFKKFLLQVGIASTQRKVQMGNGQELGVPLLEQSDRIPSLANVESRTRIHLAVQPVQNPAEAFGEVVETLNI